MSSLTLQLYGVQAIDARTGTKTWNYTTGNWVLAAPAVSPDGTTMYTGADDDTVTAVSAGAP